MPRRYRIWNRSPIFLRGLLAVLVVTLSGCAIGYRRQVYDDTHSQEGRTTQVSGKSDAFQAGIAADFRYFRLVFPFETTFRELDLIDDRGGEDHTSSTWEQRVYRLDAPLLSVYDFKSHDWIGYPGVMEERQSLDLWVGGEHNLYRDRARWWIDAGIGYYHFELVAVRLVGGYGQARFRASTHGSGPGYPMTWEGQAASWGAGLQVTLFAGEYGLKLLKWVIDVDRRQRRMSDR